MGTLLVTGGAGFIGSALIRQLIDETDTRVINVDALTYAGNLDSLGRAREHPRHVFEHVDIRDRRALDRVFQEHHPDAVAHLAAESHVDRSIASPDAFVDTNVTGTCNLLEAARSHWEALDGRARDAFRFLHVSTDEVYGDLGLEGPAAAEGTAYAPSSPYAASKAASDHLVRAWHRTYGLPVLVTNGCNSYGPWQFPEKLVPLVISNARDGKPLPLYGHGDNVRDWLFVEDHARALRRVLEAGEPPASYNIGGGAACTNLEMVRAVCAIMDEVAPRAGTTYAGLIRFVADRPGHDKRYAVDDTRIRRQLGWQPAESLATGLRRTVRWYLDHAEPAGSRADTIRADGAGHGAPT